MIEEFDKDNAKHESNLETLKNIAFEKSQRDVDWKLIGFQGDNPRTDFRAGGHLSLLCIIYMFDNYNDEWNTMNKFSQETN